MIPPVTPGHRAADPDPGAKPEPLRLPPDEFALVKDLALKISPDLDLTPEQIADFKAEFERQQALGFPQAYQTRTPLQPVMPAHLAGSITIEWPPPGDAMPGHGIRIFDAGDGTQVFTVTGLTVHAGAEGIIWAECVMLTDDDGNPLPPDFGMIPGEIGRGTFAFRVTGMSVAPVRPRHKRADPA